MNARNLVLAVIALFLATAGIRADVSDNEPRKTKVEQGRSPAATWTLDAMLRVNSISGLALSADGKQVAYVVDTYVAATPDWAQKLFGSDRGAKPDWARKLFMSDTDGKNKKHLLTAAGHVYDLQWCPDGQGVLVCDTAGLYRVALADGKKTTLVNRAVLGFQVSPDGKWLAYSDWEQRRPADQAKKDHKKPLNPQVGLVYTHPEPEQPYYSSLSLIAMPSDMDSKPIAKHLTGPSFDVLDLR